MIAHVLYFLETDEAVRTSILSSKWRYLWKGVTRISLSGNNFGSGKFSSLLEHVLQNCTSTNFLAYELNYPLAVDISCLNTWISRLHSHKIEKLIVHANNIVNFTLPVTPLPQCILSYSTLVTLKLHCFEIQIPESIASFPHLKSIDLQVIFPDGEAAVNRLLSCCPVLENLNLFGFLDDVKVLKIDISVSTLGKLDLRLIETGSNYRKKLDIVINAPNLEHLYIDDDSFNRYVVKNLSLVSNVFVNYESFGLATFKRAYKVCLLKLFKGIATTRFLTLLWSTVAVLRSALSYGWPTFPYLITLVLHLSSISGWTC
ncbi:hypothetical protein RDABS01_036957 [Bienertia sinuspersici]